MGGGRGGGPGCGEMLGQECSVAPGETRSVGPLEVWGDGEAWGLVPHKQGKHWHDLHSVVPPWHCLSQKDPQLAVMSGGAGWG